MEPYYDKDGCTIYLGDCREILPTLEPASVNCCVTSPPYWGLRDYGTATWEGGDAECGHKRADKAGSGSSGLEGGKSNVNHAMEAHFHHTCGKCGATRIDQQIGLESTPAAPAGR